MRYLKKFNESNIDALDELKDFCEGNLAFLLDDLIKINYIYKGQVTYGTPLTNKDGTPRTITHEVYKIQGWFDNDDIVMIRSIEKKSGNFEFEFEKFSKVTNTYDYYEITKDKVREDKFWSLSIKVEI